MLAVRRTICHSLICFGVSLWSAVKSLYNNIFKYSHPLYSRCWFFLKIMDVQETAFSHRFFFIDFCVRSFSTNPIVCWLSHWGLFAYPSWFPFLLNFITASWNITCPCIGTFTLNKRIYIYTRKLWIHKLAYGNVYTYSGLYSVYIQQQHDHSFFLSLRGSFINRRWAAGDSLRGHRRRFSFCALLYFPFHNVHRSWCHTYKSVFWWSKTPFPWQ